MSKGCVSLKIARVNIDTETGQLRPYISCSFYIHLMLFLFIRFSEFVQLLLVYCLMSYWSCHLVYAVHFYFLVHLDYVRTVFPIFYYGSHFQSPYSKCSILYFLCTLCIVHSMMSSPYFQVIVHGQIPSFDISYLHTVLIPTLRSEDSPSTVFLIIYFYIYLLWLSYISSLQESEFIHIFLSACNQDQIIYILQLPGQPNP